jgi:hypothetical protein
MMEQALAGQRHYPSGTKSRSQFCNAEFHVQMVREQQAQFL